MVGNKDKCIKKDKNRTKMRWITQSNKLYMEKKSQKS